MAKALLIRLYGLTRSVGLAAELAGLAAAALLAWVSLAEASLAGGWSLQSTRLLWLAAVAAVLGAGLVAIRSRRLGFAAWVRAREIECGIDEVWSCAATTPPSNPFFPALDRRALALMRTHERALRRGVGTCAAAFMLALAGLLVLGCGARRLLEDPKIAMAAGVLDDSIRVTSESSLARGEDWHLAVTTLQPGPYRLELRGNPGFLPFTGHELELSHWTDGVRYRVHTAWGRSAWRRLEVYEPVTWKRFRAEVRYPAYLERDPEVLDLLGAAPAPPALVVEGTRIHLAADRAIEWAEGAHADTWTARAGETHRVRPADGTRHGLWMALPIRVVPDLPPVITWERPESDLVWGPQRTLLQWTAEDDFGLRKVQLAVRRLGAPDPVNTVLWKGRLLRRHMLYVLDASLVEPSPGTVYEVRIQALDSKGQWGSSESRFLEVRAPESKDKGPDGQGPRRLSLRGVIVALTDTVRDWDRRDLRLDRLHRARMEMETIASVSEDRLKAFLTGEAAQLSPGAGRLAVENVLQTLVRIQQRWEDTKPGKGRPSSGKPSPQTEPVTAKDLEELRQMQEAAEDPQIGDSVRQGLQSRIQERFQSMRPALAEQLPQAQGLIDTIAKTQATLARQWDPDLAQLHGQQLGLLKEQLAGAERQGGDSSGLAKGDLLDRIAGQVEGGRAVGSELMGALNTLAAQDRSMDWSPLEQRAQRWNRALKLGLPSLVGKAKADVLESLEADRGQVARQALTPSAQADLTAAVAKALGGGDWDGAAALAAKAGWSPAQIRRLSALRNAPAAQERREEADLLAEVTGQIRDRARLYQRDQSEHTMPVDPKWEPSVDKYFEILEQKGGQP